MAAALTADVATKVLRLRVRSRQISGEVNFVSPRYTKYQYYESTRSYKLRGDKSERGGSHTACEVQFVLD